MVEFLHGWFEDLTIGFTPQLTIADIPDGLNKKYADVKDNYNQREYINLLMKWIKKCCDVTRGPVFFIPNQKWIAEVEIAIWQLHVKIIQRLIWQFNFGQHQKNRYALCFRPIYWLNDATIYPDAIKIPSARQLKYNDKRACSSGKLPDSVWPISLVCGTFKERRKWHPCQLPTALIDRIILGHSQPGDLVFDPFIGSGTTAFSCKKLGRNCIGADASREYISKLKKIFGETHEQETTS